mgnify:CR=1 FL=1
MLTKERCMSLLDDIAGYAHRANIGPNGINEINEDYNGLKKLIEEHFTPQPLEFKNLKPGMWVMDMWTRTISKIKRIDENRNVHLNVQEEYDYLTPFKENRFYPIAIPNVGDKNEKHI